MVENTSKILPRIDLLILHTGEQFLVSEDVPDVRYPVKPDDGKDASGLPHAIRQFRAAYCL